MKLVNLLPHWPLLAGLLIGAALGALLGYFGQCTSGACPLTATWWRGALYGGFMGVLFALPPANQRSPDHAAPGRPAESGSQQLHQDPRLKN